MNGVHLIKSVMVSVYIHVEVIYMIKYETAIDIRLNMFTYNNYIIQNIIY